MRSQRNELKAAYAQRRADIAEQRLVEARAARMFAETERTSASVRILQWSTLMLAATLVVGYFGGYRPLVDRSRAQRAALIRASREQGLAIEAARRQFESDRAALLTALGGERAKPLAPPSPSVQSLADTNGVTGQR